MYASRLLLILGMITLFLAWVAFKAPEVFFHGRRSGFWYHWIGEAWTRKLIRYVSVPLVLLLGGMQLYLGLDQERMIWQATHGNAEAQYQLADHLYRGDVQGHNVDLACRWFERAAENGSIIACVRLSQHHIEQGDQAHAFTWLLKAAEYGDIGAGEQVAYHYAMGIGIQKNLDQAWHWYDKAAAAGRLSAQLNLGRLALKQFRDAPSKGMKARQMIDAAVAGSDSQGEAALLMAHMVLGRIGGPGSLETGYAWLCLAAARGSQKAELERDAIENAMSIRQKQLAVREKQRLFNMYASLNDYKPSQK